MKLLTRGRVIAAIGIIGLGVVLVARGKSSPQPARIGVPHDWSHRQVVFSRPANISQAIQIQREPRYWQQIARRSAAAQWRATAPEAQENLDRILARLRRRTRRSPFQRDWAVSLGPGATTGTATYPQYPAKYSYSIDPNTETMHRLRRLSHECARRDRNQRRVAGAAQHHRLPEPLHGGGW